MTGDEIKAFHDERIRLFPTRLSATVLNAVTTAIAPLEFQQALRALKAYSAEKPYRGFYPRDFLVHYGRAGKAAAVAAAPQRSPIPDEWMSDRCREEVTRRFEALPEAHIVDCINRFEDLGWPAGSTPWKWLCIWAADGEDVTRFRLHPAPFSDKGIAERERRRAYQKAKALEQRSELHRLRARVTELEQLIGGGDVAARVDCCA